MDRASLQGYLISAISFLVFSFLDLIDFLLCLFYRFVDGILEGNPSNCYCQKGGGEQDTIDDADEREGRVSETLYGRRNIVREIGFFKQRTSGEGNRRVNGGVRAHRWSDCGCEDCGSWERKGEDRLHVVVMEPAAQEITSQDHKKDSTESVIFLHGFLSSSSIWVETIFPNLSESATCKLRMFAVDLLGFGRSPKPATCSYTLEDHVEQINRSVLKAFQVNSLHLVAHSMGCIIAISLAAKYPDLVKSVTLVAPPYFPQSERKASYTALNRLAQRRVWPPMLFGSSVMSWYEHLGRTICFIICRNHQKWEWILGLITKTRDIHFSIRDFTKHTHHSAWHTMHNVICGGANSLDRCLEVLKRKGIPITLMHGGKDQMVPLECSYNIKLKVPLSELQIIEHADHNTVILGREKAFTRELENIWLSSRNCEVPKDEHAIR